MTEAEKAAEIDRLTARLLKNHDAARDLVEFLIKVTAACHVNGCADEIAVPDFIRDQAEQIGVLRRQLEKLGQLPAECCCLPDQDDPNCPYHNLWMELHAETLRLDPDPIDPLDDEQRAKAFGPRGH